MNPKIKKSRKIGRILFFFLILSLAVLASLNIAAAADHRLEILGGPITVSPEDEKATVMKAIVTIRNNGDEIPSMTFRAVSNDGEQITVNLKSASSNLPGYSVAQFELEFPNLVDKAVTGQLIIEAAGVEPAVEALTITARKAPNYQAVFGVVKLDMSTILLISFIAGFALLFVSSLTGIFIGFKSKKKVKEVLSLRMSGLKWSFSENWASTFVAAGGILATIVGSAILPEKPVSISKAGFQALNVLFPILITIAPFLLAALNALGKEPKKGGLLIVDEDGKTPLLILPFVVGCSVVTWAVIGELLTLTVLFQELLITSTITLGITIAAQVITLLLCILGFYYAWEKTVQVSLSAQTPEEIAKEITPGVVKAARTGEKPRRQVYLP